MQIVIDSAQTKITVKNKCFYIVSATAKRLISPKRLTSIAITSNAMISAGAVMLAAENQVPIYYYDWIGDIRAKMWSPYFSNLASIRRKQLLLSEGQFAVDFTIANLLLKLDMQELLIGRMIHHHGSDAKAGFFKNNALLAREQFKRHSLSGQTMDAARPSIMGIEGSISRQYWKAINCFIPEKCQFKGRSRMPAKDAFNAALNYMYGMTYNVVEQGIFATGLDPMVGFLHTENYNKTSLVFDLIEPFRPLVDELLIELFQKEALGKSCFEQDRNGYKLGKTGKRIVIPAYNEYLKTRVSFNDETGRLRDHIFNYCAGLTKQLKLQKI